MSATSRLAVRVPGALAMDEGAAWCRVLNGPAEMDTGQIARVNRPAETYNEVGAALEAVQRAKRAWWFVWNEWTGR